MNKQKSNMLLPECHSSIFKNFSWNKVKQCLLNFEYMLDTKAVFSMDGYLYMDMIIGNYILILSPKRISICSREDVTKPKYLALPPKDIQEMIIDIIDRYGEMPSECITLN